MPRDEALLHQIQRLVGVADMRQDQAIERRLVPRDDRGIGARPSALGERDKIAVRQTRQIAAAHALDYRVVSVSLAATSRSKVAA
jgi:hypothetical protein